jgi:DNA-binding MarR family transcriptional regulator
MDKDQTPLYFQFFTEIGIMNQLSRAGFEAHLPKGTTLAHFSVLNHLVRLGDGQTPLQIAKAFQLPKTTMTHTLSVLEKRGLIVMRPNPDDGRSKAVVLTDLGRKFRDDAITLSAPYFAGFAARFPPEKLKEVLPVLAEMRGFLDKERDR